MAALDPNAYPGDWSDYKKHDKLVDAIPANRLLRFPVADGYALYYIKSESPLVVQHVPYLDGYRADPALIRGLTMADVKAQRQQNAFWDKLRNSHDDFWATRKPGETVHYHNGFGQYVRGTVVKAPDGNRMKATALVGAWRSYDLPSFNASGEVNKPHYVQKIESGELMQPNAGSMLEGTHKLRAGEPDPRGLPALDLTPPPMTEQHARIAPLVRKVSLIRALLTDIGQGTGQYTPEMEAAYLEALEKARKALA